jgi:hypothetical protein
VSRNLLSALSWVFLQRGAGVGTQEKTNENSMAWKDIYLSQLPQTTNMMIPSANIRPIGTPFADQRKNDPWVEDVEERRFYPH